MVSRKIKTTTRDNKAENYLYRINECFSLFTSDILTNINSLTTLCGETLGATCAIYNRLHKGMLCSWGMWNTPADFKTEYKPQGRICYDLINNPSKDFYYIPELQDSPFANTDPNVKNYNLKVYLGFPVKLNNKSIGALCVVFQNDFVPKDAEIGFCKIIASAIGIEEARRESQLTSKESQDRLEMALEGAGLGLWDHNLKNDIIIRNNHWAEMLGYSLDEIENNATSWKNLIHPDDLAAVEKATSDHENKLTPFFKVEHRLKTKNNEWKWILNCGKISNRDNEGNPLRALGVHIDIDKRKQVQEILTLERDFSLALGRTSSFIETLDLYLQKALDISGLDCGGIYLVNDQNKDVDLVVHNGLPPEFLENVSHYKADSPNARIIMKGKSIYTTCRDLGYDFCSEKQVKKLKAIIIQPILYKDKVIACLNLASYYLDSIPEFRLVMLQPLQVIMGEVIIRKKAEEKLFKNQERLQKILESSPYAITVTDLEGTIIECNQATLNLHGLADKSLIIGENAFLFIPKEEQHFATAGIQETLRKGQTKNIRYNLLRTDNTCFPAELSASVIKDADDKPMGFVAITKDITRRKQAESNLKNAAIKWQSTIDAMSDSVSIIDLNGHIVEYNAATLHLLDVDDAQIKTKPCWQLVHGLDKPYFDCPMDRMKTSKNPEEMVFQKGDRWLKVTVDPLFSEDGNVKGAVHVVRDVTRRKENEKQIQKDLIEKKILLKEIHHRVKNNMSVMISLLRLQSQKIQNIEDAKAAFNKSCERIYSMALVHEYLYNSANFTKVDMKPYIETISNQLLQTNRVTCEISMEMTISNVLLDINRAIPCGLIINELITNIFKHAFTGKTKGKVKIRLKSLKDNMAQLTIRDNGIGLPAKVETGTPQTLGLKLIKILTEQIKGTLEINRNRGTTFIITFKTDDL